MPPFEDLPSRSRSCAILGDSPGVAGDEAPIPVVVDFLDVDLDALGKASPLPGGVGKGAGPGDGDEAPVGEPADLDSPVDGDEDFPWIPVPREVGMPAVGELVC
jgi:hypothetical protein